MNISLLCSITGGFVKTWNTLIEYKTLYQRVNCDLNIYVHLFECTLKQETSSKHSIKDHFHFYSDWTSGVHPVVDEAINVFRAIYGV